ncbi:MAG: hypothetical protein AAFS10_00115 [Myxococcota bacterium]
MKLYRPCGLEEMALVFRSHMRHWPPRLPEQPIFYPVTYREYADQISQRWNATSESRLGYVTAFEIDDGYAAQFETKIVGARIHEELWIPAEELESFNTHILHPIDVVGLFAHPQTAGSVPQQGPWAGKTAQDQLQAAADLSPHSLEAIIHEHTEHVWLNWPLWRALGEDEQPELEHTIASAWSATGSQTALAACTAQWIA